MCLGQEEAILPVRDSQHFIPTTTAPKIYSTRTRCTMLKTADARNMDATGIWTPPPERKFLWFCLPKMALWGQFYGVGGYPLTEKVCSVLVALLNWSSIWMDQNIDEAIKSGHKALLLMYIDHSNLFRNWLLLAFMSLATPARSWGLLMSSCIWLIRQRCKKAVTKETLSP